MDIYSQFIHDLSKKYIKKHDKVLDIGCGDGKHTKILMKYSNHVIGADIDNRLDKKYGIKFKKISPNDYGSKEIYDLVTSFDVIEHVADDLNFIKSKIKTLKKGGRLIIATPNRNRLSNKLISLFNGPIKYPRNLGYHYPSGGYIIHLREYTNHDFIKLFEKVPSVKIEKIYSSFLGVYTPFGPFGFKTLDNKLFSSLSQHLFVVAKKMHKK